MLRDGDDKFTEGWCFSQVELRLTKYFLTDPKNTSMRKPIKKPVIEFSKSAKFDPMDKKNCQQNAKYQILILTSL